MGGDVPVPRAHHSVGMTQSSLTLPFPNVQLTSFTLVDDVWVVEAESIGTVAACPRCLAVSTVRHSFYERRFWDLPVQGRPVRIRLTVGRWRCRNTDCVQTIFTERLPGMVAPHARQTGRAAGILRLLGHGVGGRPGERLAARLGFVGNRTTILRHLIGHQLLPERSAPRVIGLDDWAARKGTSRGIGASLARCFLDLGYGVVASARSIEASDIAGDARVAVVSGDIADPHTAERIVEAAPMHEPASQVGFALSQPGARSGALAFGTVPVTAAIVGNAPVPAVLAGIDVAAKRPELAGLSTAEADRLRRAFLRNMPDSWLKAATAARLGGG